MIKIKGIIGGASNLGNLIMVILGPVLIVGLFMLLSICTYTYFTQILPRVVYTVYSLEVSIGATIIGIIILSQVIFNYIMCILRGPGYPSIYSNFEKCRKCKYPKPPRAHHCSICKRCVLRMDHHCPWIANCVGHKNQRYFLLFLTYLVLICFFFIFMAYPVVLNKKTLKIPVIMLSCTLTCVFGIILFFFAGWH